MKDTVSLDDLTKGMHSEHARPSFVQTNLISDGSFSSQVVDSNLVNPWGVSFSPTSPFWISENATGLASVDKVDSSGNVTLNVIPAVTIPTPDGTGIAAPTGQVFNSFSTSNPDAFVLSDGKAANFLFATEDGTIAGWNAGAGTQALLAVDNSTAGPNGGAVYKGLAIGNSDNGPTLYAANFRDATVDMFDQNFNKTGSFTDANIPNGFAPFNVEVIDDKLFVTYAKQDDLKHDDVAGKGNGYIDEFDLKGNLITRVASQGKLDSPWGMAIAPGSFGKIAGDLLVGNFGDGHINVIDPNTDKFLGQLKSSDGGPVTIQDLWALTPGNGGSAGSTDKIYFTSGGQGEAQGLFGSLSNASFTSS
jgi:uncharacterized protein (TIGR03118 family)